MPPIRLSQVLSSIGNPLIGHEIILREYWFPKRRIRTDVYFQDFIRPFLEKKVGSLRYDISPMKHLYSTLKIMEEHISVGGELQQIALEEFYETDAWERVVLNMPMKLEKRIKFLALRYKHHTLKNAIRLIEDNFPVVME
jgi:hypothetical protein